MPCVGPDLVSGPAGCSWIESATARTQGPALHQGIKRPGHEVRPYRVTIRRSTSAARTSHSDGGVPSGFDALVLLTIEELAVNELREHLLGDTATPEELEVLRKGLTSEMVAAVAKICSNGDLIYGAKKLPVVTKANTTLGLSGRFSCRLQPNDTRDDSRSIAAQIYEGLSYGAGDALIGVNPVTDNVESATRTLDQIYEVIEKYQIPTQGCVLAHIFLARESHGAGT